MEKYKLVSFSVALEALKEEKRVARNFWNAFADKDVFVFSRPSDKLHIEMVVDKVKSLPQTVKDYYLKEITYIDGERLPPEEVNINHTITFKQYLCLKNTDGEIINGWLPSQEDIFAEDWIVLD